MRRLARALHQLLAPRAGEPPPVIGATDWRKIELLAFGLDRQALIQYRDALTTFGIVTPVISKRADGNPTYHAWLVNPTLPHELDELGEDLDEGDDATDEPTLPDEAPGEAETFP